MPSERMILSTKLYLTHQFPSVYLFTILGLQSVLSTGPSMSATCSKGVRFYAAAAAACGRFTCSALKRSDSQSSETALIHLRWLLPAQVCTRRLSRHTCVIV